jgi:hypothetical protein
MTGTNVHQWIIGSLVLLCVMVAGMMYGFAQSRQPAPVCEVQLAQSQAQAAQEQFGRSQLLLGLYAVCEAVGLAPRQCNAQAAVQAIDTLKAPPVPAETPETTGAK